MSERRFEVTPVGVDYICDTCEKGLMNPTGVMLTSDPPKWPHRCSNCGHEVILDEKFPTIRFERNRGW